MTRWQIIRGYFKRRARFYRNVVRNRLFTRRGRAKAMSDLFNDIEQRRQERTKL